MFIGVSSLTYHSPITIESFTYGPVPAYFSAFVHTNSVHTSALMTCLRQFTAPSHGGERRGTRGSAAGSHADACTVRGQTCLLRGALTSSDRPRSATRAVSVPSAPAPTPHVPAAERPSGPAPTRNGCRSSDGTSSSMAVNQRQVAVLAQDCRVSVKDIPEGSMPEIVPVICCPVVSICPANDTPPTGSDRSSWLSPRSCLHSQRCATD